MPADRDTKTNDIKLYIVTDHCEEDVCGGRQVVCEVARHRLTVTEECVKVP